MFDFPNAPTNGQQVTTPNGTVFTWDGVKWTANAAGGSGSSYDTGRNLINNPLFNINQRSAGPYTVTAAGTLDRWALAVVTDTVSVVQATLLDADRTAIGDEEAAYAFQNVFTGNAAAGAGHSVIQRIENVRRLANKTVTVSFYAKAAAGTPKLGINIAQNFGTGGSPSASLYALATGNAVTLSTTWARYSTTIAMPSLAGKTLGTNFDHQTALMLWFSSGATNNAIAGNIGVQSGTVSLWGVQLEVGTIMTPLEKPDPQQDWAKCQRFYQTGRLVLQINGSTGNALGVGTNNLVAMRAMPAAAPNGASSNVNTSGFTFAPLDNQTVWGSATVTATGTTMINYPYSLSADFP